MIRRVFRHAFVPSVILLSASSWIFRAPLQRRAQLRMDYPTTVFLALALVVSLAEVFFPARREWNYNVLRDVRGVSRLGRDLLYLFVLTQVSTLLVTLTTSHLHALVDRLHITYTLWPSEWPFAARVVLAFFAVEFCSYWIHRMSHHVEPLWRFHSTHHVGGELSALVSLRMHPIDNVVECVFRVVPLALAGAGADELVAVTYLSSALSLLAHANVDVSDRGLGLVVNFPRFHAVHHSADLEESRSNFGCHTVLWDRVFGTFRADAKAPLALGVAPLGRRSLWQELAWPFYRRVS